MDTQEKKNLLEIRQTIYSFLGISFLEMPALENIKAIIEQELFEEFPLEIAEEDFKRALALLNSWAKETAAADYQEALNSLKQDYSALFIGPGHLLAPPWESVYLTEEKLTFGEPTIKVRNFYLAHGFQYVKKNTEPDDHFGLEMEFMSKLIAKQLELLTAGKYEEADHLVKVQLSFLEEHPLKWLDNFADNVLSQAKTSYFQGLALLTKSFLKWDYYQLQP